MLGFFPSRREEESRYDARVEAEFGADALVHRNR
jgi:hypothetical protein